MPKDLILLEGEDRPSDGGRKSLWFDSPFGLISVKETWQAVVVYYEAAASFSKFEQHFGVRPERGLFSDGTIILKDIAYDRKAVKWRLVWPVDGKSIRDAHLNTVIRHELAHEFVRVYLWPRGAGNKNKSPPPNRYGSEAPDWLDELAAMSAEDDLTFKNRILNFKAMAIAFTSIPLVDFFLMEHPTITDSVSDPDAKVTIKKRQVGGVTLITKVIVKTNVAPGDFDIGTKFYEQGAALFLFMTQQTGDLRVFEKISVWLKQGGDFDGWLEKYARHSNRKAELGASLEEFEAKFLVWAIRLEV